MLDPMDVIGPMADLLLELAEQFQVSVIPGLPVDETSPGYQKLLKAMQESEAKLKATEEKLNQEIEAAASANQREIESLRVQQMAAEQAKQAAALSLPPGPRPEGEGARQFYETHVPKPPALDEAIQRLLKRYL